MWLVEKQRFKLFYDHETVSAHKNFKKTKEYVRLNTENTENREIFKSYHFGLLQKQEALKV